MAHPDEGVGVDAQGLGPGHDCLFCIRRKGFVPRQDPTIAAIGAYDQRPAVVGIECGHVVAAVEWLEERHLERCGGGRPCEHGLANGLAPLIRGQDKSAIHHAHAAVRLRYVGRRYVRQAALERMVQPRQFVPTALVALQVKRCDYLHAGRRTGVGAACEQAGACHPQRRQPEAAEYG